MHDFKDISIENLIKLSELTDKSDVNNSSFMDFYREETNLDFAFAIITVKAQILRELTRRFWGRLTLPPYQYDTIDVENLNTPDSLVSFLDSADPVTIMGLSEETDQTTLPNTSNVRRIIESTGLGGGNFQLGIIELKVRILRVITKQYTLRNNIYKNE